MGWRNKFEEWLKFEHLEAELKEKLESVRNDEKVLEDSFYKELEFGTGGMRGELGPGTNRMNIYTIRKAAEGLARYIIDHGEEAKQRGVVIAFDSRHKSVEFAMESAKTIAKHGITCYVFKELRPTPELSFAVRHLQAFAGIVITASHNPPEYNGFKVYGEDGGQLPPTVADQVIAKVNAVGNELEVSIGDEEKLKDAGLIQFVLEEIDEAYTEQLKTISLNPNLFQENDISVVFTPLHGTALQPVKHALKALGFEHLYVVKDQENPDPEFSTVTSPNPEEHEAFHLAIRDGEKIDADLLIATDPDADRLGIAVKNDGGEYVVLTGNQTGGLFLEYILSEKKDMGVLPDNGIVMKTIVTSELGRKIADNYGITTEDTLTGFKFIGEKIKEYELSGKYQFQFGYEESYGYLIGDFVRDKDAIQAVLMAIEMAAFYKQKEMSLYEALMNVYEKYGYFKEGLESLTLKGKDGSEQIQAILTAFRSEPPKIVNGSKVKIIEDYLTQKRRDVAGGVTSSIGLPTSNVLKYILEDDSWFCVRPSGTEPKIKFYFGAQESSLAKSEEKLEALKDDVLAFVYKRNEKG